MRHYQRKLAFLFRNRAFELFALRIRTALRIFLPDRLRDLPCWETPKLE